MLGCSWDDEVAPKLCWMRVRAASLAMRNTGPAVVRPVVWVRLSVLRLPGWRDQLERSMEGEKLRKGEGTEQKGRVCARVEGSVRRRRSEAREIKKP